MRLLVHALEFLGLPPGMWLKCEKPTCSYTHCTHMREEESTHLHPAVVFHVIDDRVKTLACGMEVSGVLRFVCVPFAELACLDVRHEGIDTTVSVEFEHARRGGV